MTCIECGTVADAAARGWQCHLAYDPREDDEPLVVPYCPSCAAREFGGDVHDD